MTGFLFPVSCLLFCIRVYPMRETVRVRVARLLVLAVLVFLHAGFPCLADDARPGFKSLRYDEDYSFLSDPARRTDWWDPIKYIPVAQGRAGFLSLGGDLRERFETYRNEFFRTKSSADNAYLLQRYLVHADYHPVEPLRIFAQLQSSLEDGRTAPPRPTDRDDVDVHQLFFDTAVKLGTERRLTLRVGRQEMSYGSERLVSVREGTNNRRAFDAVRVLFRQAAVSVDAFLASPVEVDHGAFDDDIVQDLLFWGGYATAPFPWWEGLSVDVYYLGLDNPQAVFSQGGGHEKRHTLGVRLFGRLGRWDINHEAMYQFGSFGSADISAWSLATDHGYTIDSLWGKPRLGLKAAIASGDDNADKSDLQTLNPLFPRGNYFTEASLLGPQNFFDTHPCLRLQPSEAWLIDLGGDFYWRESRDDGIYTPGGSVIYQGNPDFGRFVGTDLSVMTSWQATAHLNLSAAYTHFFAGRFIHQNDGKDVDYGAIWGSYRF